MPSASASDFHASAFIDAFIQYFEEVRCTFQHGVLSSLPPEYGRWPGRGLPAHQSSSFQQLDLRIHFLRFAEHQRNGCHIGFVDGVVADIAVRGIQRIAIQRMEVGADLAGELLKEV